MGGGERIRLIGRRGGRRWEEIVGEREIGRNRKHRLRGRIVIGE